MILLLSLLAQDAPTTPAPADSPTTEPAPAPEPAPTPAPAQGKVTRGTKIEAPPSGLPAAWGGDGVMPTGRGVLTAAPATSAQREWVDEVIRQNYGLVQDCYKTTLRTNPRAAGFYSLVLQIGPSGKAEHVQVRTSTLDDPALDTCITTALSSFDYSRVDTHAAFVVGHTLSLMPADYPKRDQLLKKNLPDLDRCWAEAQERAGTQDLRGVLELRLRATQGKVYDTRVSLNTTQDEALTACLTEAMPQWKVDKALSGPYVLLFRLTPEKGVTSYLRE